MLVYRLCKRKYAHQLDGKGAALFGGRWNSKGLPVIYASIHRSLAVLEYRVNNPIPTTDLLMITLEIPDSSWQTLATDALPSDWQQFAPVSQAASLGDQWLKEGKTLIMEVPSVVVPQEHNVLINPLHQLITAVKVVEEQPFLLDQRMY